MKTTNTQGYSLINSFNFDNMKNNYLCYKKQKKVRHIFFGVPLKILLISNSFLFAQTPQTTLDYCSPFDGTNGTDVANQTAFNPASSNFSLSFWFKASSLSTAQVLVSKNNTFSSQEGYTFFLENGKLIFRINASNSNAHRASVSIPFSSTGTWHHVVGIVDRSTNKLRAYLDGSETGWTPGGGGPNGDNIAGFGSISDTSPVNVGKRDDGNLQFNGFVSDIRFYNTTLTSTKINDIGQNPTVDWSGTTIFNGSSTHINLASNISKVQNLQEGTIYARFKQASASGAQSIFAASDSNDASRELRVHIEGGTLRYGVRGDSGTIDIQIPGNYADGQWHEVVVTVDDSSTRLFIDGSLSANQPNSVFFSDVKNLNSMNVGRNVDNGGGQWYFNGEISNINVYDRALCDEELTDLFSIATTPPAGGNFSEQAIFVNGQEGYTCYRIPAIIKAPNGDLLAMAEGRNGGCGDFAQNDIVMKRSTDNGSTWGSLVVVCDNVAHNRQVITNPAPVVDMTDPNHPGGVIRLVYNATDEHEGTVLNGTGVREVYTRISTNNGLTWSAPVNITTQVHRPNEPSVNPAYTFVEDWRHNAITPGHAIQLEHGTKNGRLLFPANHTVKISGSNEGHSYAFYTDDHGATWHIGGIVEEGTNEVMAVEKTNGEILMTMRKQFHGPGGSTLGTSKYRAGVISSNEGQTFGTAFNDLQLPDPVVQGSIVRFSTTADSDKNRILVANPAHQSSRVNMTVRISYDEGNTWAVSKVINAGNSAYSDMVIDSNYNINLLYERGASGGIHLAQFDLDWLSDGADTHIPPIGSASLKAEQNNDVYSSKSNVDVDADYLVYPVPAKGHINVNLLNFRGKVEINIYNIMGFLVKRLVLVKNGVSKLNISDIGQGTYILQAKSQNKIKTVKFIKN